MTDGSMNWCYERILVNGIHLGVSYPTLPTQRKAVLLLLHGFTGSSINWTTLRNQLIPMDIPIIAIDLPGHGIADAPTDPERYRMEPTTHDIISILRHLNIQPEETIVMGYSMGGRIALSCACTNPFRALILESASPGLANAQEREQRIQHDEIVARQIEQEGIERFISYWEQLPLFASQRNLPASIRSSLHTQRLQNRPQGLACSLRGMGTGRQPAFHNRLPDLQLPVLLLAGALDLKFCAIAREMAHHLPQAQLQIVPEAGHTIHLEQPAKLSQAVNAFCTAVLS